MARPLRKGHADPSNVFPAEFRRRRPTSKCLWAGRPTINHPEPDWHRSLTASKHTDYGQTNSARSVSACDPYALRTTAKPSAMFVVVTLILRKGFPGCRRLILKLESRYNRGSVSWSVSWTILLAATQIYGALPATLAPGAVQSFSLRAKPSEILPVYCPSQSTAHLIVEQSAGDAVVTIGLGHGTPRVVDSFDFGPETLTIICGVHGDTSIQVGSAAPGEPVSYTVRYERVDRTTPGDRDRETAEDLSTQSKLLLSTSGDWDRAVSLSREALEKWQLLQDTSAIARTFLKIGDLFFARANWAEAAKYYGDAVSECPDSRCLAEAHNNAGLVALNRGDAEQSLKEFHAARDGWHELGFQSGEATTSMNLGLLYWHMSDWQSALREDARARELLKTHDSLRYARSLNNIGLVYMSMADYPKATLYFRMAMGQLPQKAGTSADRGKMWMNLGRAQMFDGDLSVALLAARRAVTILVSVRDQDGTADAWNNVGQILLKLGKRIEAEQALNRALPVYETLGDIRGNASVLHYLGQAAFQRKDYDEAEAKLQKALAMRLERRLTDDAAETIAVLAAVARSRGDIATALNLIQRSLALVEEVRSRFVGEPLRRSYFSNKQRYRDFYVETLLAHDDAPASQQLIDSAFDAVEQARARALVDLLGEERLVSRSGEQTELRLRQQAIRRDLNYKFYNLAQLRETPENAAPISGLRTEIDKALAEDSEVDSLLRSSTLDKPAATDPPPITIGELRERLLASDDTLFEFALGEKRSFLWIVTQGEVRLSILPSRSNIERKTSELLALLTDIHGRQADADKEKRFQLLRRELARMLGFDAWQPGKSAQVIVVPDGLLHRLPFTILRVRTSGSAAVADLGLIAEVMQCQSATVYKILGDRRRPGRSAQDQSACIR